MTDSLARIRLRYPPASPAGAALFDRYVDAFGWMLALHGGRGEYERRLLSGLAKALHERTLDVVSIDALAGVAGYGGTAWRAGTTGTAARRLRRLLQEEGELPTQVELEDDARLRRFIAQAPATAQPYLVRWNLARAARLGTHGRCYEIRRLVELERIIAVHPDASVAHLTQLLLLRLVREIVDCACQPISRATSPGRCVACGATADTHGMRPSPGNEEQDRIRTLVGRYLRHRRVTRPTSATQLYATGLRLHA